MLELNKIHCMDCLEGLRQMEDNSVDLIVTDPPYGIDYQSARRTDTERFAKIKNDDKPKTEFLDDAWRLLKDGGVLYLFTRWDVYSEWESKIKNLGFIIKNVIIWDRVIHGLGDLQGSYAPRHDFIIFAVKGRHLLRGNRPKDIISHKRPDVDKMVHPTEKPVKLIQEFIKNSSDKDMLICDPFMGSGTTAVACKQLGRNFIGFELSPEYCKIANERLRQGTLRGFL